MTPGVNFVYTKMHDLLTPLLLSLLTLPLDTVPPDGPYLFDEGRQTIVRWVDTEARQVTETTYDATVVNRLPSFPSFRPQLVDPHRVFTTDRNLHFKNVSRIVALSDIHGQYETGRKLLEVNGVIDADQHWIYGDGHLVIVGDVFDRGDQVTELLWLIHNLQIEAERAGGRVHFLLGNHETLTLEGDERYLNPKYRITSGLTGKFYHELYGPDTYLGRWLRSLPLAVQLDETVFIHGGLSKQMVREISSLERLNELYHRSLIDQEDMLAALSDRRTQLMHGKLGPLWYRGYFKRNAFTERDMDFVLRKIGAEHIVVGHTSFTAVQGFFDNRLVAVDSSIKFGGAGEVLIIESGQYFRGTLTGQRLPLEETTK